MRELKKKLMAGHLCERLSAKVELGLYHEEWSFYYIQPYRN